NLAEVVLQHWGYRVLTASDGPQALEVYQHHRAEIDLILLDFTMPGLTGLQILEKLRERDPDVRVVFSSGYTSADAGERLVAAGGKGFLPKPYRVEDLLRVIRRVLDESARTPKQDCLAETDS